MADTLTHNNIGILLLGKKNAKIIRRVNRLKDNPTPVSKRLSMILDKNYTSNKNPFDIWRLGKRKDSHRQHMHGNAASIVAGYQAGGVQGVMASLIHDLLDHQSNEMRERYGARNRDIIYAMFNKAIENRIKSME